MTEQEEILNDNILFKLLNREKRIKELEFENKMLKKELNDEEGMNPIIKDLKYKIGELESYVDELKHKLSRGGSRGSRLREKLKEENVKISMENVKLKNELIKLNEKN